MTRRGPNGSAFTWIAVAIAVAAVLAVVVVIAAFWSGLGDTEISLAAGSRWASGSSSHWHWESA